MNFAYLMKLNAPERKSTHLSSAQHWNDFSCPCHCKHTNVFMYRSSKFPETTAVEVNGIIQMHNISQKKVKVGNIFSFIEHLWLYQQCLRVTSVFFNLEPIFPCVCVYVTAVVRAHDFIYLVDIDRKFPKTVSQLAT